MQITRTNPFTGQDATKDLDITIEQIEAYEQGALVQDAFPNLSAGEREFIKTGITEEAWAAMFG
jgi:hypothetical protein